MSLGFFFLFALNEVDDVGMVDVQDDHLGGASRLASGFDYTSEGIETFHEAERTAGGAAAAELFGGRSQRREIRACTGSPLEEHAFGLGQGQDRVERILHRVDEAGGTLRAGVSGGAEFDLARGLIPVPVLG